MVALVGLALHQQGQQAFGARMLLQVVNLLLVVLVHKGLYCSNGGVYRTPAGQRRQGTGQPAGQAPRPQQAAALGWGQPELDQAQVFGFGAAVLFGKGQQFGVTAPAGHGGDAVVNEHGAGLARVVGAQFALKVFV